MSDNISSVSITFISFKGSISSLTWDMFLSSKHLTTWIIASTFWRLPKNLLPNPSPLLAPFTSPAISTNSNWLKIVFLDLDIWDIMFSLLSSNATLPIFGSIVQKG